MPEMPINLIKGDKIGDETDYRDLLPVNMSAVLRPMFGTRGYLLLQPGLTKYGEGSGIDRGGIWNERHGDHYRVSDTDFISVDENGVKTVHGTITGADTASLPYSFNTQGIVADGRFWLYTPGGGLNEVVDPDLGNPIDCVWVDNYYFFTDGEFLYHTDITDETAIDPLKFATAEFSPDPTLGVAKTADNKVIAFGRYSIEYFVNIASENFAFQRVATRAVKAGIVGTHCKAEINDQFYILGGRKKENVAVHVVGVGSVRKVSSREVDKIIKKYSEGQMSGVVLEARAEDNYNYLIVHLPAETLLYNVTAAATIGNDQAWTILKTDTIGDLPWRAKHGIFEPRLGKWAYGDKRDNTLGLLDDTVATHYDDMAEWLLRTPFINLESASVDELEIETMPGHTVTEDATVAISLTYDGVTYGKEWFNQYGLPSQYGKRFIFRRFGDVRDWVGFQLRGVSRSRMGFSIAKIRYG